MVVILPDQLEQLLARIGDQFGRGQRFIEGGLVHEGQLGLHHHAGAVGQVAPLLRMLIMRVPHGVDAHLGHDRHVGGMILRAQRPALALPVLVARGAVQPHRLAVEDEALVRIPGEAANAQRLGHAVDHAGALAQFDRHRIEIGVGAALP